MTRVIEWSDWRVRRSGLAQEAARLAQRLSESRRSTGPRRPRDAEDEAMITRMVRVEVERRVSDGRLVRIGPREYELRMRMSVPSKQRNATITS